ncbi:MAG: hypothetical protein ACYCQI_07670 [Gammaproteobacteria bacterium]
MMRSTQAITTLASTFFSYIKPSESKQEAGEYKKPPRATVTFSKNMTASIALPGRVIKIKKATLPKKPPKSKLKALKKPEPEIKQEAKDEKKEAPQNSTATMLTYLFSFIPTCIQTIEPLKIPELKEEECKKVSESIKPVTDKMQAIESQLTGLVEDKSLNENNLKLKTKKKLNVDDEAKAIAQLSDKIDTLNLEKIELVADLIEEHARRRVDLFFYLLLAVRGKQLNISKASTIKQHGSGSTEYGTNACHSSLFPNLKFEMPKSDSLLSWIRPEKPFTLQGTHLNESLNMTIELPKVVNEFDCRLESIPVGKYNFRPTEYVKACLRILNRVSHSEIDIPEAMHDFFVVMNDFFTQYQALSPADHKVWEYEKAGTFAAANPDLSLKNSYLHTMLRLDRRPPPESKEVTAHSALTRLGFYARKTSEVEKVLRNPNALPEFYQRIQNEILNAKIEVVERKKRSPKAEEKPKAVQEEKPVVGVRKSERKKTIRSR